jgi:prophage antirepressor-like protein
MAQSSQSVEPPQNPGRFNPRVSTINESGLYSLILGSKMPKAMEFKRWVVSVVLPAILKGRYLHQSGGEVVPGGLDEP